MNPTFAHIYGHIFLWGIMAFLWHNFCIYLVKMRWIFHSKFVLAVKADDTLACIKKVSKGLLLTK